MAEKTQLDQALENFQDSSEVSKELKAAAREFVLEAKDIALQTKAEAEQQLEKVQSERQSLQELKQQLESRIKELSETRQQELQKLEGTSNLSVEEAKEEMMRILDKELANEAARRIRENEDLIRAESDKRAREILVSSMQRIGTNNVAEYTTYTIDLPEEEMKGRIIGKDGRNIKAFEEASGVSVDIGDEGEPTVTVSSFDPVRREIAKRAMEQLVSDGRIQPTRIEESVQKAEKEVDEVIREAGEDFMYRAGVTGFAPEMVQLLGRLKFRSSYGQNMIDHTLEVVRLGTAIAAEVGADIEIVRKACLLHDVGKAVTAETDKGHAEVGADISRRYGISEEVVQAFEHHHDDNFPTLEAVVMYLADALSGARPGARKEDYDKYISRVRELEDIAKSFKGVDEAFAISAGREVRVIVNPAFITDAEMVKLSHDIAKKIHDQINDYPAPIKVHVVRETKATAIAKPH